MEKYLAELNERLNQLNVELKHSLLEKAIAKTDEQIKFANAKRAAIKRQMAGIKVTISQMESGLVSDTNERRRNK